MVTDKQIVDAIKRRKALLDECVRCLREADGATDEKTRDEAVQIAARALLRVRDASASLDDLYGSRIAEMQKLRDDMAQQGEEAMAAAQGAIARLTGVKLEV